ncbi:MAG TPA: FHA domain-containing protein [Propionibacteriaceae bacterium]|nr:FHA domain-containing protein [Propionibacteriaceae bacterium]
MSGICENGHRSNTDDYCDVCGLPVHPSPTAAPVAPVSVSRTQTCPNCGASNPADALFCEACGYDYTTGTLPRSDVAGMLGLRRDDAVGPSASAGPQDVPASAPAPTATPSYPTTSPSVEQAAQPAPAEPAPVQPAQPSPAQAIEAPDQAPPVQPPAVQSPEPGPLDDEAPTRGRPAPRRESYVAEVWIDPDWYEVQETDEPMPSVSLPTTVVLGLDNLIGRASASRNIHPEVDCGIDSGVSRRQARLSTDGTRWYVEDLGSANGTFVGPAAGPLPTSPIQGRYELGPDDRVYVGAWTRVVVRKASKDEVAALS